MAEALAPAPAHPRLAAGLAVADVLAGRSLSDSLPLRSSGLAEHDRRLAAELAHGTCRWYWRLDALLRGLLVKPFKPRDRDLQAVLLCGAYQLLYTRIPAHAAVSESVAAVRLLGKAWAAGLANGVLRRVQREQAQLLPRLDADPVSRYALPRWLLEHLRSAWPQRWEVLCVALNERPPMTLRVNRRRISVAAYAAQLAGAGMASRPVAGLDGALILAEPRDVAGLPGFAEGAASVQDAGAQRAAALLDLGPGQRVLDACAAPGGKTGHLLELEPGLALTALDVDPVRLARVADNLRRLGQTARLLAGDAAVPDTWWEGVAFDRILLDVPCSATGVIRRHPDIRVLRREADIPGLTARQDAILHAVWPLLRPGGKLLYATCSLLPVENEDRVSAFLQRQADAVALPLGVEWGHPRGGGRQLLPGEDGGDGFFYALLHKAMR